MRYSIYLFIIILVILLVADDPRESFIPYYPEPIKIDSYCSHQYDDCCQQFNCQACQGDIYYRRW